LPPRQGIDPSAAAIPAPRTSPLAFASLVSSLLWLFGIGSVAAIVLGVVALRQIGRSNGTLSGRSLAIAGPILGIAGLGLLFALFFARLTGDFLF
jgi:hypothetical protein